MWSQIGFFVQHATMVIVDQWPVIGMEEHGFGYLFKRIIRPYKSIINVKLLLKRNYYSHNTDAIDGQVTSQVGGSYR